MKKISSRSRLALSIVALIVTIGTGTTVLAVSSSHQAPVASKISTHSTKSHKATAAPTTTISTQLPSSPLAPGPIYSSAIKYENALPGSLGWGITGNQKRSSLMGYFSSTSVNLGGSVNLFVSSASPTFSVSVYRMGWYGGALARLIWKSGALTGFVQANCPVLSPTNTVECNWKPSLTLQVPNSWPAGDYIFKLIAPDGQERFVPLTITDYASNAAILVINAVTTWQAYNQWGGYDLYQGPYGPSDRATKVSFNRPYDYLFGQGTADFIGNELPLVSYVEKLGLNVTYVTSIDIQKHPTLLLNHQAIISPGHDEYWSSTMRDALRTAINHGVNVAFLGANAIFRHIRLDPSANGTARIEVNYRLAYKDPLYGVDNSRVTTNWPSPPDPRPESSIIGIQYRCNPVRYPMVITDPSSWVFSGSKLVFGSKISNLIGSEFDGYDPYYPTPSNLELLANSPVLCRGASYFSDMSYYTAPSGAGIFATGTSMWVASLTSNGCPPPLSGCPFPPTQAITKNILLAFATAPAGIAHPSIPNATQVFYHPPIPPFTPPPPPPRPTTTSTTSTTTSTTTTAPNSSSTTIPTSTTLVTQAISASNTSTTLSTSSVTTTTSGSTPTA